MRRPVLVDDRAGFSCLPGRSRGFTAGPPAHGPAAALCAALGRILRLTRRLCGKRRHTSLKELIGLAVTHQEDPMRSTDAKPACTGVSGRRRRRADSRVAQLVA